MSIQENTARQPTPELSRLFQKLRAGKIGTWSLRITPSESVVIMSPEFLTLLGHVPGEASTDWKVFSDHSVHPEDLALLRENLDAVRNDPEECFRVECRVWSKLDNDWRWVFIFGSVDEISPDRTSATVSGGVQDIQDRIDAQKAREREHVINKALIGSLPGAYLVVDTSGKIVRWNSHFAETFTKSGKPAADCVWADLFGPEDLVLAEAAFQTILTRGSDKFRAHISYKDGARGLHVCQGRMFAIENRRYLLALFFDISDIETAQTALYRERSRLDTIISAARLGTWDWNLATDEVIYNAMWADIAGVELSSIQGSVEAWEKGVLPEDLSKAMAEVEAHCKGETPMYEAEFRMRRGDGSIIWGIDRGRLVEWAEDGTPLRLMGVLQEITESKQAEVELVRSRNQLELVVRETHIGTWDWNPISNEILFNDAFFTMLGYAPGEIAPSYESWASYIHPDDLPGATQALAAHLEGRTAEYECEVRMRHKNGDYVWTYDLGRVVERNSDGAATRVVGGHFDINRRKQQEQEQKKTFAIIAAQKKELEQTIAERTLLLGDIRQRLDAIVENTGSLPNGKRPGNGRTGERNALSSGLMNQSGRSEADRAADAEAVADTSYFAARLGKAFDLITEKMWWYKAILDSIPFPISVTDMNRHWTYLNRPALETVGARSLHEVAGRLCDDWGPDQPVHAGNGETLDRGTPFSRFHPELSRFFQGQFSYLYDQKGRHIGHIEAMQDVTQVHEADERTRLMLDATPLTCNFWNSRFESIDCNLEAVKLFRLSSKQEYLERFTELSPSFQPDGESSLKQSSKYLRIASATGYCRFEWMHQRLDGSPIPAEITLVRVKYGKESILLSYIRDLTELKLKEAELDKERRLLLKIMESSPVCFVILVQGIIRFATPYALKFFGVSVGSRVAKLSVNPEEILTFFDELARSDVVDWKVVALRAADGSTREMLANAFEAEYYGEPCVMSWLLDVTEMRETERQLRLARDAAEENTKAKGYFLANMSHEIRTPMNAILGMTRIVLETDLSDRQRAYLEKAEHSAGALLRIINDILDFSKIEADRLEMEMTDFSLADVLRDVIDIFREKSRSRGLSLSLSVNEDVPAHMRGDSLRLHQVLTNLVSNAVKFTEQGEVSLHVRRLAHAGRGFKLHFRVRDTGIGLAREQQDRLFLAFTQADTSTTRRYGGTGLGLVISKRLVEMMHGELNCVSEEGRGAEFSFTACFDQTVCPLLAEQKPGKEDRLLSSLAPVPDPAAWLRGRRILVAEDNEINQIITCELLEKAGLIVDVASNGAEAVTMALANFYDLVFMDIQMPEMDGLTATAELRKHPSLANLPVVAMTAHAMVGDREKSLAVGMNDHITKPIDSDEVFRVMTKWINERLH